MGTLGNGQRKPVLLTTASLCQDDKIKPVDNVLNGDLGVPIMKILLAVDISHSNNKDEAQAAAELVDLDALSYAVPLEGNEITLLFVKEELPSYEQVLKVQADFPEDLRHVVERRAGNILTHIADALGNRGANVKKEIVSGLAAQMVEAVAGDEKVDLTVVVQRSSTEFLLSGTAEHVARHSPSTTLILRAGTASTKPITSVVVGVDGSQRSLDAITRSLSMACLDKAITEIELVHVVNVSKVVASVTPFAFVTAMQENLMMEGEVFLANAKRALSDLGYKKVNMSLKAGNPAAEILSLQQEKRSGLIVIGAQGGGAIKHFLMGHICERVINHAKTSILVARES